MTTTLCLKNTSRYSTSSQWRTLLLKLPTSIGICTGSGDWYLSAMSLHTSECFLSLRQSYWWCFNRLKLFGPMQKCLVAIMAIDVFFLLMTGLKDFVFNALNWNHGFIEYKVCMFMLIFIRIQTVIYGTSLWIKSLMLIQRVLMLISPFNACVIEDEEDFFVGSFYSLIQWISVFSQIVYFTILPICIHCICTILLIVIVRKEINRLSLLTSTSKALKNLNYKF